MSDGPLNPIDGITRPYEHGRLDSVNNGVKVKWVFKSSDKSPESKYWPERREIEGLGSNYDIFQHVKVEDQQPGIPHRTAVRYS